MSAPTDRPPWPETYSFGDFVRLVRDPQLWGRVVGPSELSGRWMFEYPHGARVTADEHAIEPFVPTTVHYKTTHARFEHLAQQLGQQQPFWPEQYRV